MAAKPTTKVIPVIEDKYKHKVESKLLVETKAQLEKKRDKFDPNKE